MPFMPGEVGVAAVAASGTDPVVVGGFAPRWGRVGVLGSFGMDVVAGRIRLLVGRGIPGGRLGSGAERPPGGAAIPGDGAAWAPGVVVRWGRVVGSGAGDGAGVGGGGVGSGSVGNGGGGAGGRVVGALLEVVVVVGLGGGGGGGAVGTPPGPPGVPVRRGGRASFAALGAAKLGG